RHPMAALVVALAIAAAAAPAAAQKQPAGGAGAGKAPAAAPSSAYETALARYKECIARLPFVYQTEGREKLAQTRCPEALAILTDDYKGTKAHPQYARYTLGTLFGRCFLDEASVAPLQALRNACDKPVDTWLWCQTLRGKIKNGAGDEVATMARDDKNML